MNPTNGTVNPFATDTTGTHAGLYKGIGVGLAVASGVFIGSSFVFKKRGLLQSIDQSGGIAGEGYTYLKSTMWWSGMILMIVGELCNFIAYAFTQAILVTPLGALSVVISAVLSSIFLKERLSFQGKVGCLQCILGAIVIVLHAPEQSSADTKIETFKELVLSVGFLVYGSIAISVSLFLVFYCGPRWGKKNMLVYITVCSLIGSISVVFTQGLGSAIVHTITYKNENQFKNWFIYLVLGIVIVTLLVEIVYLNKALNLFNTALVTPTYYVIFTTMTIVSSIVLYRGFDASPVNIATCVLGFLCICSGVSLLHNAKSDASYKDSSPEDEKKVDEEGNPIQAVKRRKSMFKMFENQSQIEVSGVSNRLKNNQVASDKDRTLLAQRGDEGITLSEKKGLDGAVNPGAADLFPAPFTGIGRYASTTKRSQTIISQQQQRKRSATLNNVTEVRPRLHSNSISVDNTTIGEEGYNRELKRRDDYTTHATAETTADTTAYPPSNNNNDYVDLFTDLDQNNEIDGNQQESLSVPSTATPNNAFSVFARKHSLSFSSSSQHRAQNGLDPLSSYKLQLNGGDTEDRKGLVDDYEKTTLL